MLRKQAREKKRLQGCRVTLKRIDRASILCRPSGTSLASRNNVIRTGQKEKKASIEENAMDEPRQTVIRDERAPMQLDRRINPPLEDIICSARTKRIPKLLSRDACRSRFLTISRCPICCFGAAPAVFRRADSEPNPNACTGKYRNTNNPGKRCTGELRIASSLCSCELG